MNLNDYLQENGTLQEDDTERPLKEVFFDYFSSHPRGMPADDAECKREVIRGLDSYFELTGQEYVAPESADMSSGLFISSIMKGAMLGSLREALENSVKRVPLGSLPSDNNHYRALIEQAMDMYEIMNNR